VKKLVLSLLCGAAMSVSASAMALPTQAIFGAFIVNGPIVIPVGTIFFDLDADIPGKACRYYYEWDDTAYQPLSADGYLVEGKSHGAASCFGNAFTPITSIVTLDPTYPATGFDRFQQFRSVLSLVLGGSGPAGQLAGLIQYGAPGPASTMFNSFELGPGP
jgi:hypothetical protein